jgi:hypothetical protein
MSGAPVTVSRQGTTDSGPPQENPSQGPPAKAPTLRQPHKGAVTRASRQGTLDEAPLPGSRSQDTRAMRTPKGDPSQGNHAKDTCK